MNSIANYDRGLPPKISFAPGIYEKMLGSVGRFPPEHYAILSGYLNEPYRVTDFMPMPPASNRHGINLSNGSSVTLNGPFIEYYLNTVLIPAGMYVLGAMHSHPGDMNFLSSGVPGSGQGDIPSMRAHLQAAVGLGRPWHNYLAPIVTRPGATPDVKGWVIRLDCKDPIPADIVWESEKNNSISPEISTNTRHYITPEAVLNRLGQWQEKIQTIKRNRTIQKTDRDAIIEALRKSRSIDMEYFYKQARPVGTGSYPQITSSIE